MKGQHSSTGVFVTCLDTVIDMGPVLPMYLYCGLQPLGCACYNGPWISCKRSKNWDVFFFFFFFHFHPMKIFRQLQLLLHKNKNMIDPKCGLEAFLYSCGGVAFVCYFYV